LTFGLLLSDKRNEIQQIAYSKKIYA